MRDMSIQFLAVALILFLRLCTAQSTAGAASATPSEDSVPAPTFHAGTSLVLVDVIAQNQKTGIPVNTLQQQDFRLFDNNHEVSIATFDSGAHYGTRPVALWFVLICNEKNNGPHGEYASGGFLGKEIVFRPALNDLDKRDSVGVAHWCDNGDATLDLKPTLDGDAAIAALGQVLKPFDYDTPPPSQRRKGELALQKMVRLIIDDAHARNP